MERRWLLLLLASALPTADKELGMAPPRNADN